MIFCDKRCENHEHKKKSLIKNFNHLRSSCFLIIFLLSEVMLKQIMLEITCFNRAIVIITVVVMIMDMATATAVIRDISTLGIVRIFFIGTALIFIRITTVTTISIGMASGTLLSRWL